MAIQTSTPPPHVKSLDGLRGIAILATVGVHVMALGSIPAWDTSVLRASHIFQFGWMGVDLFFVLSGFLITGILLDTAGASNYFRSFYSRRMLRIFPLYYLVIFSLMALSPWLRHTRAAGLGASGQHWGIYIAYLQAWWKFLFPDLPQGHFLIYWTLSVEEQFYLLWPLVVYLLPRGVFIRLCVAICFFCPLLRWFLMHDPANIGLVFTSTLTRMDTLVWGALAALLVRQPQLFARIKPLLPYILGISAAILLLIDFPLHEFYSRSFYTSVAGFSVIAIGAFALLLLAYDSDQQGGRIAKYLSLPILRSLGRYSYGMYVWHVILLGLCDAYLLPRPWFGHSLIGGLLVWPAFFVITLAVAWLSFHAFERPFLRLKKNFRARTAPLPARRIDIQVPARATRSA